MRQILSELGTVTLSLVLSLVVWLVAAQSENPIIEGDLATPIRISRIGLDSNLAVVGQPLEQASLTLQASQRVWEETLRAQDFVVEADLTGLGPGSHSVPLVARHPQVDVEIVEVTPPSVVVNLETVATRVVPVEVEVLDQPAFGYEWRTSSVTPTTVTVSGPVSLVDAVAVASVEFSLRGARTTIERLQPVTLRNSQGEPLTAVKEIVPRSVRVSVDILQSPGYRDVSVRVPYTGQPAQGYQITGIVVDPSLITLQGNPDAFEQLPGFVETLPIDIDGATDDISARLALALPESLAAVGLQSVSVRIEVDPILLSRSYQVEPVIRGLGQGLTRTIPVRTVDVLVSGPLPVLDTVGPGIVQVVLDLTGLGPGVHSVRLNPVLPEGMTLVSLLPESLDITIFALPTPTPQASPPLTATLVPTATIPPEIPAASATRPAGS